MIHHYRGLPVPYITAWTAELEAGDRNFTKVRVGTELAGDGAGGYLPTGAKALLYTDETPQDRDRFGVLWNRLSNEPGQGEPVFGAVHPGRERECMTRGLCQCCGGPASVWIAPADPWRKKVQTYGADHPFTTVDPPICAGCADAAARYCPKLSGEGFVLLTASAWANTAVRGMLADPVIEGFPENVKETTLTLPGTVPPPDLAKLRMMLVTGGLLSTLWGPKVVATAADSPGLGVNVSRSSLPRHLAGTSAKEASR